MKTCRFISLILVACFLFFGCNSNKTSNLNKSADSMVSICAIVPLTGDAANLGKYVKYGLTMAVDEQNENGGLLNKKIVLNINDSKTSTEEATIIAQSALNKTVKPLLLFSHMSPTSLAIKPFTENNKTILMAISGSDKLLQDSKYTFRDYTAPNITGKQLAKIFKQDLKFSKIGMFYVNDDWGRSTQEAISANCKLENISIQFISSFDKTETNYKVAIRKELQKDVDIIHIIGYGASLGRFIKQLKQMGYQGKISGDMSTPFPDVHREAGDSLKGVYYLDFDFDIDTLNNSSVKFSQLYSKYVNEQTNRPSSLTVLAYEGLRMTFKCIENIKSFNNDSIVKEMNLLKNFQGRFHSISIDNYDITYKLKLRQFPN